ncbi:hypothetical protein B0T24DRAFT_217899 [Lasiosphaeria ovina]|uniref:Uncharacterized protein n=1 Tax=Lasiosphaeria ovina TaxID=92902 RepID=A0AAE0NA13_9PEZI|nr:hypothetical protein B0T24DRAFT_217899 [Lasiosphaeria ovina]
MEFIYKEAASDSTTVKGKKKKQSTTKAQKLQRAADAGLRTRVYKHHRCRGKHCNQGPHYWPDEQGNHHTLLPRHLEDIFHHIKGNLKEGEREEDFDVNIEIPSKILKDVLDDNRKRKADDSIDYRNWKARRGDPVAGVVLLLPLCETLESWGSTVRWRPMLLLWGWAGRGTRNAAPVPGKGTADVFTRPSACAVVFGVDMADSGPKEEEVERCRGLRGACPVAWAVGWTCVAWILD